MLLSCCCHVGASWPFYCHLLSFWCILSLAWSCHVVVILVQFGHCVVIVLSLCCHLGALDDCHCVVIVLRMLVHVGHVVVIVVVIGLPCWCI